MTACLSFHQYSILRHFCLSIRRNQHFERRVTYVLKFFFSFLIFFCLSVFSFSFLFATGIDLLLDLFPVEDSNFYHGLATCSCKKFCFEFFTQLLEHFWAYFWLHWADHSDLGIIGKIQMIPILVKGDDFRSGTRNTVGGSQQVFSARKSVGQAC